MTNTIQEVPYPDQWAQCKNVEHWGEMIIFGKCNKCGKEIAFRKSDIPRLARDIEIEQREASGFIAGFDPDDDEEERSLEPMFDGELESESKEYLNAH